MPADSKLITRRHRVSVEFRHVDLMGVVHNAVYFNWFELGRLQVVEEVIPVQGALHRFLAVPVVVNHCEYIHPARYLDRLVVTTTHRLLPEWSGRFVFNHSISHEKSKNEICRGHSAVTVTDTRSMRVLKELPEDIWARYLGLTSTSSISF